MGRILGSIISGGSANAASTAEQYERGKHYLNDIALLSGGRTFKVERLSGVKKKDFERIADLFKPNYYLTFELAEVEITPNNRTPIKVRVNKPYLVVRARGSFIARK